VNPFSIIKLAVVGALVGALAGFGWQQWSTREHADNLAGAPGEAVKVIPQFSYPDLKGRTRESREWSGKATVINFWATWCPPCREETPLFVELQEQYRNRGVQFVGVAIDDAEPTQDFVDTYGVNYPVLLGDASAIDLSKRLGNHYQGLPYTIVTRPNGRIASRITGGVKRTDLEPLLEELAR
jgi:thiol-disulfide isomerase/thioredoxin